MINYIVDEHGNKTHAIVPIDTWNNIKNGVDENSVKAIIDGAMDLSVGTIPVLMHSMGAFSFMDSPTFSSVLKDMFWYINSASPSEIGLMYLLRTAEFSEYIMNSDLDEKNIERLSSEFYISDLQGYPLSLEKAQNLRSVIMGSINPESLLKEFRKHFIIGSKNNKKRIRRDAEMKRLFIFDALDFFPRVMPELMIDESIEGFKDDLSTILYPENTRESAIAQLNKAYREAKDRIYANEWVEYIGK